jgi:hypothetical protein
MRTVRLARVAAQAEIILIRRTVAVAVRRAIYGVVAAIFALAVLTLLHVLAVLALERFAQFTPIIACAIVLGVDLVIAVIFGLLAAGEISDPVADEARQVRDQSLEQARQSLTFAALLAPATRLIAQTGLIRILIRAANGTLRRSRA